MVTPSIKWSSLELPKELGGLGIGNIMHKNLILLFKWWWKRILLSVHKIKGLKASSIAFNEVKDGIWAQLMSDDSDTSKIRTIVEEGKTLNVGSGVSILFWHDKWCEIRPLKRAFP